MDAAALAEAAERLRRAAGALQWQLSQTYSERRWEATKALRGAEATLAEAREREAALVRAQQEEPARHALFAERITQLSGRIAALQPQLAGAAQLAQARLQDIAVAELQAQQERLGVYAAQARLAIAQIHDQAQFARRSDAAAPSPEGSPR
jgi:chromosome segregation ATPase